MQTEINQQCISSNFPLDTQFKINEYLVEILDEDNETLDSRIKELKELRRHLSKNKMSCSDVNSAIRKLSRKHTPDQIINKNGPYEFAVTINCCHDFSDPFVVRSFSHMVAVANRHGWKKNWHKKNLGMCGFAVLERHSKLGFDRLPHWHCLLKAASGMEGPLEYDRLYEALSVACYEQNTYTYSRDCRLGVDGQRIKYPVFNAYDIELTELPDVYDDQNFADYSIKNIHRSDDVWHDQWGIGLYHFNRNGLVKIS